MRKGYRTETYEKDDYVTEFSKAISAEYKLHLAHQGEWIDGWVDKLVGNWMDGWMDGRMDGWMNGWMEGKMVIGWTVKEIDEWMNIVEGFDTRFEEFKLELCADFIVAAARRSILVNHQKSVAAAMICRRQRRLRRALV